MNLEESSYNLITLKYHEATLDEEDSFYYLSRFFELKKYNYTYRTPYFTYDEMIALTSSFSFFYGKITDEQTGESLIFNTPINVFRYIMLEDGSWDKYYTVKRKYGYVVEGMYWSNGMLYQLRDSKTDEIYEITLSIDHLTKTLYNFPDVRNADSLSK